jgi:hypothetical protein
MAKPSKIAQYLANGDVLREMVNAYRRSGMRPDVTPLAG